MLGLLLLATPLLGGCRAGYLGRLAVEQARYLGSARPIDELVLETDDPVRRARLELVAETRSFAEAVGLSVGGSYREVADTDEAEPFHVVTAAYVDRLEPYTWWYPIVGRIPYRGYFDAEDAERFASRLGAEELDTRIVRASAYSTLGWFDDPLPSSLLNDDEVSLATVVLHELVHQTFFAPGHVAFNETLANAIGYRLAIRFFRERQEVERVAEAERRHAAWLGRSEVLDRLAGELRDYFADARGRGAALREVRAGRAEIYDRAAARMAEVRGVERLPASQRLEDNATFLAVYRYATEAASIDRFVASYSEIPSLIAALERVAGGAADPFEAVRTAVLETSPDETPVEAR